MTFKNEYLSSSRLQRYAQCPRSFEAHYIDDEPAAFNPATTFGSVLHAALERIYRAIVAERICGRFPEERLIEFFEEEWAKASLFDYASFQEGVKILRDYACAHALVDYSTILGVEQEFRFPVDEFEVRGFIDRADRIDDETVLITDYKSNRAIFTREDVDQNLQLSVYAMAARVLWPWAKKVRLAFYLLRHGFQMETARSDEDLAAVRKYVVTLGRASEQAIEYPARLNENCNWCDHRMQCPVYHRALLGKVESVCQDEKDLEAVAREREEVAKLAKALYARKEALERILKKRIENVGELKLGGMVYGLSKTTQVSYPVDSTLLVLNEVLGDSMEDLARRLLVVDKAAVEALLKNVGKDLLPADVKLLKARLDAVAEKSYSPRFVAHHARNPEVSP
jgi:putative RecB family exonuclease